MPKVEVTLEEKHGIPAGIKLTPMMKQYVAAKGRYPDALLFFRMGDFYEMFFEDAEMGGRYLDLTVTSRDKKSSVPAPMSGFPHHQLPQYLQRALDAGLKVAVCDQMEDPTMAKGLVRRDITRVVTPGVVLDGEGLEARTNNFLVAITPSNDGRFGIASMDVSTGEFKVTEVVGTGALRCEISRLEPREVLVPEARRAHLEQALEDRLQHVAVSTPDVEMFSVSTARAGLEGLMGPEAEPAVQAILEFGFGHPNLALCAAGAAMAYVTDTQQKAPHHTRILTPYKVNDTLVLDETAKVNLELFKTLMGGRKAGSLLGVIDSARTAMGGRRLRQWLAYPLVDPVAINRRLDAVQSMREDAGRRERVRSLLEDIYDLERLNSRITAGAAGPRDLWFLRVSLERLPGLIQEISQVPSLAEVGSRIDPLEEVLDPVAAILNDDPPSQVKDGGVVRPGVDPQLDEYVKLATHGKDYILQLEQRERERTGIGNLKVRYNRVFGYYIEVSKVHLASVPPEYIRKQTLTNAERYFTSELKEFEEKVLNAETRRLALENEIFDALRAEVASHAGAIGAVAQALSELDALGALAEVAHVNDYCRPVVDDSDVIHIVEGRHPVVERSVGREQFVPNSVRLDREQQQVIILTGPNMAGKSTIMRQVALITLMAQMGGFVPAQSAHIGVTDRIFTRVGASDDLAAGRSTFMVEMHETATILNEASPRSLLILDEIGRGTSTFDGVSIAWAVAEYIHDVVGAKTLFATHYHELTDMAEVKPRVRNYTIAVKEDKEEVIFLRQLVEGGANRSYGIQVGRLAGLPTSVVQRARQVLQNLEGAEHDEAGRLRIAGGQEGPQITLKDHKLQMSLFAPPPIPAAPSQVEQELRSADLENMTPIQALNFVHGLRARLS
ncbi:MAG: DNA mismatch repair protein MutS [Bradymonadia bacterium]